jgi:cytochrome c553
MPDPARFGRSLALGLAAAAFFALAAAAEPVGLPERIAICAGCHGADGNSPLEFVPSIAAQPEYFLLDQLIYMREGVRVVEPMAPFVKSLTDTEIAALAKYYSALPARRIGDKPDPALARRGAALAERLRCASCHLPTLAGQEQIPRLAGQRIDYLVGAMTAYRDYRRRSADTLMSATLFGVSDDDILALAHFAASR